MSFLNWILNLAGLLLWIDWRTGRAASQPQPVISLASAVRPTNRRRSRSWESLAGFCALLLLRPVFYYTIGSALEWTPLTDLFALSLPWRSDIIERMFAYSTLNFAMTLGLYYGSLLLLSAVRSQVPEAAPIEQFLRTQLGFLDKLPWPLKVLLPFIVAALSWAAMLPLLVELGLIPAMPRAAQLSMQSVAFALAAALALKWVFILLFLLDLINTYVYLGGHAFWKFVSGTSGRILRPLRALRLGRFDLAPIIGMALLLAVSEFAVRPAVLRLFENSVTG